MGSEMCIRDSSDSKNEPIKTLYLELNVKDKPVDTPADSIEIKEG